MTSRLARAGVVGAMAIAAVVAVTSIGAPGGAQADATSIIENPGFDAGPAVSHDGRLVVFASTSDADGLESALVLHDRGVPAGDGTLSPATTPIPDSLGAVNPSISGDGCIVTWSVAAAFEPDPETDPTTPPTDVPATDPADTAVDAAVGTSDPDAADGATLGEDPEASEAAVVSSIEPPEPAAGESPVVDSAALQAAPARVVVLDRCSDPTDPAGIRVDLPLQEDDQSFGPAAVSLDGSVIAVSNGTDVIRFARPVGEGYTETHRFDGSDSDATDHLVAPRVDVSDDGSVVVFSGGLDLDDTAIMTVFAHVVVVDDDGDEEAATTPVLTSATDPTVSGDGTLVVGSTGADGASVVLVDRTAVPLAPVDLGPGRRPAISADGNHVVFEESANLAVVSRTGQGDDPFSTTQRTLLSSTITPTRSGPVIDRFGTTVVSDRGFDPQSPPEDTDVSVTVLAADAGFDAELFDLGSGDVDTVLTATITFSNRGPASVGVDSIAVDGTFTIDDDRCGDVVRPGTTCGIDVSFRIERLEDAFGVVTLTPVSFGVDAFTTRVSALGVAPPVPTPSTTATTTPGSSTGGSTTGGTTGSTRGSTTGSTRGSTSSGSSSTGGTRTTTTTTTTTVAPGAGVSASPATFDFAPTIIDAGRRTGLVEIVNNGSGPVTVLGVRLDPAEAGPFQIVETTCAGESVAVGARCGVTLSFAPTVTGAQSVTLVATLEGGIDITVPVAGIGAPAPTISVIPGVATTGQVVTLRGAGFPTGITVDVTWASNVVPVVVDDAGTFSLPVVVMSHTPSGPATVSVAGQTDLFATSTGTLVVTTTSDRSGPSILDGVGVNVGR